MYNRIIIQSLKQWANSEFRKPLVLRGARQVGKTTAIDIFSKEFDQYIYLNLERPGQMDFFKKNLSVQDVFSTILLSKNIQKTEGRCLLFIDEIQNSPEAINYLRYFLEEMPGIHVCAAGSLLDAMVSKAQINFPVGRVEFMYLYPLSFAEFLEACNSEQALSVFSQMPVPEYAQDILLKEFHRYVLVGGMPEVVKNFAANSDLASCASIYQDLMVSFLDDIPKYASNQTNARIMRHCLEIAPKEAGKRISFTRFGNSEYRSRETGEAIKTLETAMLLYLLNPSLSCNLPIIPDTRKAPRLQFLDTGLLLSALGIQQHIMSIDRLDSVFKGMVAEHIVCQEIMSSSTDLQSKPCFWVRENPQASAEVDFIIPWKDQIIPIEVKSGSTGSLRSLHQFIDRSSHANAVRLYSGNINLVKCRTIAGKEFNLLNLPYYLASKIPQYCEWAFGK